MRKIAIDTVPEQLYTSPKGTVEQAFRPISEALGRNPRSLDLNERHPFDVELQRIPPGKAATIFHSHSAQWEFYVIVAGSGMARHDGGVDAVRAGDAFLFKPGEAHQILNTGEADLLMYVIADNPIGESTHYPDSGKWAIHSPESRVIASAALDYWAGEE